MLERIREAVWTRSGGRCERVVAGVRCGAVLDRAAWTGHMHHLIYRGHGRERLDDLLAVCLACHGAEHPGRVFLTKAEQAARHAVRVARRMAR